MEREPLMTDVILEGAMGEAFGREWRLCIETPAQALRLINANKPGLDRWVRDNAAIYSAYHIVAEYEDGTMEDVGEKELGMHLRIKSIRFVPVIEGAGDVARIVVGAVLIAAAFWSGGTSMAAWTALESAAFGMGVSLVVGGIVGLLTKTPTAKALDTQENKTSYYFNGPVNTIGQGPPVSLIYGRVLAGSNTIHVSQSVQQI